MNNFEHELLSCFSEVKRKTEKFIYTIEVQEIRIYFYRINWKPSKYDRFNHGYDCTMYRTKEEAEKEAKIASYGRDWFITKETYDTTEIINHKYKRS